MKTQKEIDKEYCQKLMENIEGTSKKRIISMVKTYVKELHKTFDKIVVLDVGCADGWLSWHLVKELPEYVKVFGVEPNTDRYSRACCLSGDSGDRLRFINSKFDPVFVENFLVNHGPADIVIFSSVMHEIASDGDNGHDTRYTAAPILNALSLANEVLSHDGYVIVRDFIRQPLSESRYVTAKFADSTILHDLRCFLRTRNAPMLGSCSNLKLPVIIREDTLMEFLMCETWGPDNWDREIREKKLIMEPAQWTSAFMSSGFDLVDSYSSKEDYPIYFSKLVTIEAPLKWEWPEFTFVKSGRKICICR